MNNLHPIIAAALAPWTPPPRTAEEEARYIAADLAEARDKNSPDYEQRRADRIERMDAAALRGFRPIGIPGEPK
jgi:hypothetical protein